MERTEHMRGAGTEARPEIPESSVITHRVPLESAEPIVLRSDAFEYGEPIPRKHSGEGGDVSPSLHWSDVPQGTKELVLVCEDPDAPRAEPFIHWVVFAIPPEVRELPEGIPAVRAPATPQGAIQCRNSRGQMGYMGPMPPPGHGTHHYHFQLFAVNRPLVLREKASADEIIAALEGHVLGVGEIVGTYERR